MEAEDGPMKQKITRDYLIKTYVKSNSGLIAIAALAAVFAIACIALIPEKAVGIVAAVVVLVVGAGLIIKLRKRTGAGSVAKAYFKLQKLSGKKTEESRDPDDPSNVYSYHYMLWFGDKCVEVEKTEFEKAAEGDLYYVAYFSETASPFACFARERFELSDEFVLQ